MPTKCIFAWAKLNSWITKGQIYQLTGIAIEKKLRLGEEES
jgi:hypothetical protein